MEIVRPIKVCYQGDIYEGINTRKIYTKNIKGLPDSLIKLYYPIAGGHPRNGLKDSEMKLRSKTPEKTLLYTFRYEYFYE